MAKKSVLAREDHRRKCVKSSAKRVAKVKKEIKVALKKAMDGIDEGEVFSAMQQLNKLPRDTSKARLNKRCRLCGRPRSIYRKFGLCRICLRKAAMRGDIPGLVKASW